MTAAQFLRFLACWQHVDEEHRLEGPAGVARVVDQLAGFEAPVREWERSILPRRVRGYRREWLDERMLAGEVAWGRLFGAGRSAIKATPVCLVRRDDVDAWLGLAGPPSIDALSDDASRVLSALRRKGALFPNELWRRVDLPVDRREAAIGELIGMGILTSDSFATLRSLHVAPSKRRGPVAAVGRFSLLRDDDDDPIDDDATSSHVEFVCRQLLKRTGVLFRRTLVRERIPVPWRDQIRCLRTMELRGEVRGGRFVEGFDGEQYALPDAVALLRAVRRRPSFDAVEVSAADPLNFQGILTPDARVSSGSRMKVSLA